MAFPRPTSGLIALSALLLLAGCDKPKPRGPAAAASPTAAGPRIKATTEPAPALPGWAGAILGKGLKAVFPDEGACRGNTDAVDTRYQGASPGAKIIGWGWDSERKAPVDRVILVDRDFQIVGAGEGGLARPDVSRALPEVTSSTTGWAAVTTLTEGYIDAYGLVKDGQGVCKLGHVDL